MNKPKSTAPKGAARPAASSEGASAAAAQPASTADANAEKASEGGDAAGAPPAGSAAGATSLPSGADAGAGNAGQSASSTEVIAGVSASVAPLGAFDASSTGIGTDVLGTIETGLASSAPLAPIGDASELRTSVEIGGDPDFDVTGRVIYVRSVSPNGRRRAGIGFSQSPVPVRVDDLTDDQLATLLSDPELVVQLDD